MKRILASLLALCMLLCLFSGCARVEATTKLNTTNNEKETAFVDKYIDLHLHLDGAISPKIAKILAEKQNIELPTKNDKELEALLQVSEDCTDLNEFLECFALPCSLIQTPEGVEEAFYQVLEEARSQGVVYAEIRFAPQLSCEQGMTQEEVIRAALKGLERSELKANIILCAMRGEGNEEQNEETLALCAQYLVEDGGVVALDLAGAEALYPTENYRELFEKANELGVPFTIHAGEAAGAESVKLALEYGAKRIGHGVRSFEDAELLLALKEQGIALEMCPTSNRQTHAVEDMSEYPFMDYLKMGLCVTLNTDDPAIENTTLADEYRYMEESFGLTLSMEKRLLCNSVNGAFTSEAVKAELREELGLPYELLSEEQETVLSYSSPFVEGAGKDNKIILDTDMYYGNDDAAALFMCLYEEKQGNCKVMGITTVGGNTTVAESTATSLRTLELLMRTDIPVYMGEDEPYEGYRDMVADGEAYGMNEWYGAYWDYAANDFRDMENINRDYTNLDTEPACGYPTKVKAKADSAVGFIIETIHKYPGQVTLFVMGSGANVARALDQDPTIAEDAAGIIYMGGAIDVRGNSTASAEFNWWYDPEGIQKCLEGGWKSSLLIPNDAAEKSAYTKEIYDAIAECKTKSAAAKIMAEADYERFYGDDDTPSYVWDALIPLAYFHPEMLTGLEERYIACETTPGYNYGRTNSWWSSRNRNVEDGNGMPAGAVKMLIVNAFDEDFFWDYYVKGNSW